MRRVIFGVGGLCMVVGAGCQPVMVAKRDLTIAPTPSEGMVEGRAALDRPIGLPGHEVVLVPFVKENEKGWFDAKDPYQRSGTARMSSSAAYDTWLENASYGSRSGASYVATRVRWHNAFGRDLESDERWMLLDRRGVISSVGLLTQPRSSDQSVEYVLYLATTEDTNGDGKLDSLDARRAWMADGDARNPRLVTPEGMSVVSSWIDWEREHAYFQLLADTDGDGRFTDADESAPWLLRLGDYEAAQPLIDQATVDSARDLLEK